MTLSLIVLALFAASSSLAIFLLHVYGIILSFKKTWYFGVIALLVPWFAVIVGAAKFFFKKNLLK